MAAQRVVNQFTTAPVSVGPERAALAALEMTASGDEPGGPHNASPVHRPVTHSKPDRDHAGCVMFSPDGQWLAVGEANGRIRLLQRATGKERVIPVPDSADYISALAFSANSRQLAAGYGAHDRDVHVWDLETDREIRLSGHSGGILSLAFANDGRTLASASADQTLCLWDVNQKTLNRRFHGHTDEVWAVAWSPDGEHVVTGGKDGSGREVATLLGEPGRFAHIGFSPDGNTLFAASLEGKVLLWRAPSLEEIEAAEKGHKAE